jgi:heme-degrading monooxygenase HmoA
MLGTFHSLWTFEVADDSKWNANAQSALSILQKQPGFISATILRSADEPQRYLVQSDWLDVHIDGPWDLWIPNSVFGLS